jgi:hypothetical protein
VGVGDAGGEEAGIETDGFGFFVLVGDGFGLPRDADGFGEDDAGLPGWPPVPGVVVASSGGSVDLALPECTKGTFGWPERPVADGDVPLGCALGALVVGAESGLFEFPAEADMSLPAITAATTIRITATADAAAARGRVNHDPELSGSSSAGGLPRSAEARGFAAAVIPAEPPDRLVPRAPLAPAPVVPAPVGGAPVVVAPRAVASVVAAPVAAASVVGAELLLPARSMTPGRMASGPNASIAPAAPILCVILAKPLTLAGRMVSAPMVSSAPGTLARPVGRE